MFVNIGIPGVLCEFQKKNLASFEENLKYKLYLPFATFCDFETATTPIEMLYPENREMFATSYVIIFTLHPYVDLYRVVIEKNFGHGLQKISDARNIKGQPIWYGI